MRRFWSVVVGIACACAGGVARAEVVKLGELEAHALSARPEVAASAARIRAAGAEIAGVEATYYPTITGSIDASMAPGRKLVQLERGSPYLVAASPTLGSSAASAFQPHPHYGASLAARGTFYDFGRTQSALEAARAKQRASEADADARAEVLVLEVRAAYLRWSVAQELWQITQQAEANAKAQADRIAGLIAEGAAPPSAATAASSKANAAASETERALQELESARLELSFLSVRDLGPDALPDPALLAMSPQPSAAGRASRPGGTPPNGAALAAANGFAPTAANGPASANASAATSGLAPASANALAPSTNGVAANAALSARASDLQLGAKYVQPAGAGGPPQGPAGAQPSAAPTISLPRSSATSISPVDAAGTTSSATGTVAGGPGGTGTAGSATGTPGSGATDPAAAVSGGAARSDTATQPAGSPLQPSAAGTSPVNTNAQLQALETARAAAEAARRMQSRMSAPALGYRVNAGIEGQDAQLFPVYGFGIGLTVPLWDGGATSAAEAGARASEAELGAQLDAERAREKHLRARRSLQIEHADKLLALAQDAVMLADQRVQQLTEGPTLGTAEQEAIATAQADLVKAKADMVRAKAARVQLQLGL